MQWTGPQAWRQRRVLVTGASGFLGGAVCQLLLAAGADVHGTKHRRPCPPGVHAWPARFPVDARPLLDAVRPDVVLHLASPVDLRRDPQLYDTLRPGILDTSVALSRAALDLDLRFVQVGTCEESAGGPVPFSPDAPASPTSPYSTLKAAATTWVLGLHRSHGLRATVVRPFRAFGPGEARGLIPAACRAALARQALPTTDGRQVREWNHVDAIAHGIVAVAAHPDSVGRLLNLGGGPRLSVHDMVQRIFRLAGADPALHQPGVLPRRPGEVDAFWGDHRATDALIGPLPHEELDTALLDTLAWYRREQEALCAR